MFVQPRMTFKVFMHWNEDSKPEVRRFMVENNITSFQELNEKLHEVFTGLNTKTYSVMWKDEEGDDITISSDKEVVSALSVLSGKGNIIKLNVFVNEVQENCDFGITDVVDNPTVGPSNFCHRGVTCKGCNSAVVGFRYKCGSCKDVDLCLKCEGAGIHPEHCMVRIPSPVMPHAMIQAAIKNCQKYLISGTEKRQDWLETFAAALEELAKMARDIDQYNTGIRQEKLVINGAERADIKKTSTEAGQEASGDDNKKKGLFCHATIPGQSVFSRFGTRTYVPQGVELAQRNIYGPPPQQRQQFASYRPYYGLHSNNWYGSCQQRIQNPTVDQILSDQYKKRISSAQLFGSSKVFTSQQQYLGMPFPTSVPPPEPAQTTKSEPTPAVEPEPSTASDDDILHHPKPHINNAVKHMLGMGFTDEGGWLTRLVDREDGDISAVLEYLPAVSQPPKSM